MIDLIAIAKNKTNQTEMINLSREDTEACVQLFLAYLRGEVGITGVERAMWEVGHVGKGSSAYYKLGRIVVYAYKKYGIEIAYQYKDSQKGV